MAIYRHQHSPENQPVSPDTTSPESKDLPYPVDGTLFVRRSDQTIDMGWRADGQPFLGEDGRQKLKVTKGDAEKTVDLEALDALQQEMRDHLSAQREQLGGKTLHHIGVEAPDSGVQENVRVHIIHDAQKE